MKVMETTFYLGRETLISDRRRAPQAADRPSDRRLGASTREDGLLAQGLFILMTRNARSATAFFGLPPNRVVELGAQISSRTKSVSGELNAGAVSGSFRVH